MTYSEFVDRRLHAFLTTKEMWGSNEAVETQALLLVEIEFLGVRDQYQVQAQYVTQLQTFYPGQASMPLFELEREDFHRVLVAIIQLTRQALRG